MHKEIANDQFTKNAVTIAVCMLVMAAVSLIPDLAMAGAGVGQPLDDTYTTLTDWTQGSIGKVITLAMILVGIVAGVARQSLMAFAVGIAGGLGLYNAPGVVDMVFTATL